MCLNIDTVFANNSGGYAGALYIHNNGSITNVNCTFRHNDGYTGAMYVRNSADVMNNETRFFSNTGRKLGGSILLYNHVTCENTNSNFQHNSADEGGVIFGRKDVQIINTQTKFTNNTGQFGGSIILLGGSCINTKCIFQGNSVSEWGGAIYGGENVEIINIEIDFLGTQHNIKVEP